MPWSEQSFASHGIQKDKAAGNLVTAQSTISGRPEDLHGTNEVL